MATPAFWVGVMAPGNVIVSTPNTNSATTGALSFSNLTQNTTYTVTVFGIYANNVSTGSSTITTTTNLSPMSPKFINGLLLWFDATDPLNTGTAPVDGTTIPVWYDKSGNGRNANASVGILYNVNGLSSGYPALTFTNSQWLFGSVPNTNPTMTIFVVYSMNQNSSSNATIIGLGNIGLSDDNDNNYVGVSRQNNTGIGPNRNNTYVSANTANYSTPYLTDCWFDGTNEYTTTQNGSNTTTYSAASTGNFGINSFVIGNNTNIGDPNGPFYGYISEIIVYNISLSTVQRQIIEGYLSWKWGLNGKLPTSHPYYSVAPTSLQFSPPTSVYGVATNTTTIIIYFTIPSGFTTTYTAISNPGSISTTANSSPITITGLSPNTSYTFTVANNNGSSTSVSSVSSAVITYISAPTIGTATIIGSSSAKVTFTPNIGGGAASSSLYTVTSSPGSLTAIGTASPISITGLSSNTTYTFTVTATTSVGTSTASAASNTITTYPGPPLIGLATAINSSTASVSFSPNTGGDVAPITSYTVTSNPVSVTTTGTRSPIVVSGLSSNTNYTFNITATTSVGTSSASTASNIITTYPGPPSNVVATAINSTTASVSFSPNIGGNGVPITSYTVTSNPISVTTTGTSSPIIVSSLFPNNYYTFTVTETSNIGTSTTSAVSNSISMYSNGLTFVEYNGYYGLDSSVANTYENVSYDTTTPAPTVRYTGSGITDFTNITTSTGNKQTTFTGGVSDTNPLWTVIWNGYFLPDYTGAWTFGMNCDDGGYIWIGDNAKAGNYTVANATLNNGQLHGMLLVTATVNLTAGIIYPIRILFGENYGGADCQIYWTNPNNTTPSYNFAGKFYSQ
jgi:GLEYA domain/Fibronectin type III domain